MENSDQWSTAS